MKIYLDFLLKTVRKIWMTQRWVNKILSFSIPIFCFYYKLDENFTKEQICL